MKNTNPTKPSQCEAAASMSETDADHPYASIFYTTHHGRITFFGLRVTGTQKVEEGMQLVYEGGTTNPDDAPVLISGSLDRGLMCIDAPGERIELADRDMATDFVSMIRMVYSMAEAAA